MVGGLEVYAVSGRGGGYEVTGETVDSGNVDRGCEVDGVGDRRGLTDLRIAGDDGRAQD